MFSAYINSFKIPELRQRILFTIGVIALVRVTSNIPCPGIDAGALQELFEEVRQGAGGGVMNIVNIFSGGAMQRFAVAALGIMPFISASIIMQMMTPVIPALEKLRREGETGQQKINQYTRYLTVGICLVQGTMFAKTMANPSALPGISGGAQPVVNPGIGFIITTVIILTAGTMFLVWLGEQISEFGIGNGASLIIAINIVSRLPSAVGNMVNLVTSGGQGSVGPNFTIIHVFLLLAAFFAVCAGTVALTQGHRKIPVKHARRSAGGGGSQAGQTSYLPLRVNYAGVMPIIFGSAIMIFPSVLFRYVDFAQGWARYLQWGDPLYVAIFAALILGFAFFWVANQFNPTKIADDLQKRGGYVPGIRPGQPTAEFLDYTMTRITTAGALCLVGIAILPMIMANQVGIPRLVAQFFGGTSLLIMVGVVLDTLRQMEGHLLSRHYDGFLKKGRLRSRRG